MAKKKSNLPMEVHDHFRKANVLHGYVEKDLGSATNHALETGEELAAAKKGVPHGSWEDECKRLFDGSLRTAQFYMQFHRDVSALPKTQRSAVLLLEGSLAGAAKAAKEAANPKPPKPSKPPKPKPATEPESEEIIDVDSEPVSEPCPDCGGTDVFEDGSCASCIVPDDPETGTEEPEEEFPDDETIEDICKRESSSIESWARQLSKMVTEAQKELDDCPTMDELNARIGWERKFKEAMNTLRATKPVPCPLCDGDNKKCACKGHGRVTKQQYNQMV